MLVFPDKEHLISISRQHPLTVAMILVSCVPYLLLQLYGLPGISDWFMPLDQHQLLQLSGFWKLWTPTFVHYTFLHLLTNLVVWWIFASRVEQESGLLLLSIVLISAAAAHYTQWYFTGPKFGGLSGVNYALLAYVWLQYKLAGKETYHFDQTLGILLLILIPLSATEFFGKYSNHAHLVGLLTGSIIAALQIFTVNQNKHKNGNDHV